MTDKKTAKKEAYNVIKELVDKQQDPKYKTALVTVRPSLYGISTSGGSSLGDKFIALVTEKGSLKEDEAFAQFKVGRKDCANFIKKALKKSEPANRVWISFNASTGIYKVEGKGPKAPESYKGFIPTEDKVLSGPQKML